MADLIYSPPKAAFISTKFDTFYREQTQFAANIKLFFNNPPLRITCEGASLTLLGSAGTSGQPTEIYLENLLKNFNEERIAQIKKELAGQWILIIAHNGTHYIFSDFLQIRALYYAPQQGLVCSSFGPLHATLGGEVDNYKCFEFLAMRHCLYPVWLGNTTLNSNIYTLRGFEYIKITPGSYTLEIKYLTFDLDNTKVSTCNEAAKLLYNTLERVVATPEYQDRPAYSSITGGFDSRLISTLVRKHYPDTQLRIGVFGEEQTTDLQIAGHLARIWKTRLEIHKTDRQSQKELFFQLTDGLTPQENAIITELLLSADAQRIGFGGVLGTEMLMSLPYETPKALTEGYISRVKNNFAPSEKFLCQFSETLQAEFATLATHYRVQSPETREKDLIRLLMISITSRFSGPQIATYDIFGHQLEPFATYPALATALRIPYLLMGGKGTIGGFYLVPKTIMRTLDRQASLVDSTHFSPMYPFGPRTCFAYALGKFRRRKHIATKHKTQQSEPKSIFIETPDWTYHTTEWAKGFTSRYLPEFSK